MEKEDLIQLLNAMLIPAGFKHRGSNWTLGNNELIKVINLQKSNFSNCYYINYGYIIKDLKLTTKTHISNRLYGNTLDGHTVQSLLNLENNINDDERISRLEEIINWKIMKKMEIVNDKKDLLCELRQRPHLNDIPGVVKNYFNL